MVRHLWALGCGVLFAVGLVVSGMVDPHKVLGFLDVGGAWDPSLAFVMGGALAVDALAFRVILRRPHPWWSRAFHLAGQTRVDGRLVAGSALFGAGWGLAGYCPGPAWVAGAGLGGDALVLVGSMVAGMALVQQGPRVWSALSARVRGRAPAHAEPGSLAPGA